MDYRIADIAGFATVGTRNGGVKAGIGSKVERRAEERRREKRSEAKEVKRSRPACREGQKRNRNSQGTIGAAAEGAGAVAELTRSGAAGDWPVGVRHCGMEDAHCVSSVYPRYIGRTVLLRIL